MKISCIIVDDEQYARKLLAGYVEKIPTLELVAQCKNSMEAMQSLQENTIQLMFLDIQMPDLTGIEFLKTLNTKPVVIFTTAYQEYALEGYELDVIDYMLKPISFERFIQGVNKAIDLISMKRNKYEPTKPTFNKEKEHLDYINVKADYKIYRLKIDDILYIEGLKEYVTFYTKDRKYIVHESLKNLDEILSHNGFMRVHKSFIVHIKKIDSLYGNIIEIDKSEIPIGKTYNDEVKGKLFD